MKLEWEECPRPGCLWLGRADGRRYLATSDEEKLKIQGEHNAYIEQIATANGYIKADPPITSMHDPRLGIKRPEPWHIDIDALAVSAGYVKLEDDEIVVKRGTLNALIDDHCADCTFDSLEIHDCDNCDLKPIRDRLKSEESK